MRHLLPVLLLLAACGDTGSNPDDAQARIDYEFWSEEGLLNGHGTVTGAGSLVPYSEDNPQPAYGAQFTPAYTLRIENADFDGLSDFEAISVHLCDDAVGAYDSTCAVAAIDRYDIDGFHWWTDAGASEQDISFTIDGRDDEEMWGTLGAVACAIVDSWGDEWGVHYVYYCYVLSQGTWSIRL
jgi:hypothetical protein